MVLRVETVMAAPRSDQFAGGSGDDGGPGGIAALAAAARRAEALGFDGLTVPEAGHDPFLPLAIAAEHTRRVALGTNVAIAFPRSPLVTAQLAWDLQHLSGGRFRLGLGTQVRGHVQRRYAATWTRPPGPRLREYVACVQAMFAAFQSGERPRFEGDEYQFTLMNPVFNPGPIEHPHVPIHLAAVNPYMARLAGELCDGLRLHPIATFRYTREVVAPALAEGAAAGGRDLDALDLIGAPFLAVGDTDEELEEARTAVRQHVAFYASTRTYHAVLDHHGWTDIGLELHELSKAGRWAEMAARITDDMLEEWAVVATSDQLADRLAERCGGLFSTVLLDLPPALAADDDWVAATVAALHERGAP